MRKTNFSKSSLSACNARPVHTEGPLAEARVRHPQAMFVEKRFASSDRGFQAFREPPQSQSKQLTRLLRLLRSRRRRARFMAVGSRI
jgi:hypothetical protein